MHTPSKRKPLFSLSGNRLGSNAQRYFMSQPAFRADHGAAMTKSRPLPRILEVQRDIAAKLARERELAA